MSLLPDRKQHITTTQTTTTQIVTTEVIHDSDLFSEEDLERASAIFRKYYPDRTLESVQSELADSPPIDSVAPIDVCNPIPPQPVGLKQLAPPDRIELQNSTPPEMTRSDRQFQPVRISAIELHKYPLVLVGIFSMFLMTYPIAMSRVSQMAKFAPYGAHLKSLTPEYQPSQPK
jgi:hypothetical protein